jgi:YbbR domain-containing protein
LTDLADSLSLSGPAPSVLQAELRGTAKQLIRLRVTEPPVKVSLAGVSVGRYERSLGPQDLPLPEGVELQVDRMVSPRTLELQVDRRVRRTVPVAARIEGVPSGGVLWDGRYELKPDQVTVSGPEAAVAALDSVVAEPVSVSGHRDTMVVSTELADLPDWCTTEPERVEVRVPLEMGSVRRFPVDVDSPRGASAYRVSPSRVTAVVTASRRRPGAASDLHAVWWADAPFAKHVGRRVVVRPREAIDGVDLRFEPDSVTLLPATR